MCLTINKEATEKAKKEKGIVTRYKILDYHPAHGRFCSMYHNYCWNIGVNIANELKLEGKYDAILECFVIQAGAFHVYVKQPSLYCSDRYRQVVEVECDREHLVAIGHDTITIETEAYTQVTLTAKEQ